MKFILKNILLELFFEPKNITKDLKKNVLITLKDKYEDTVNENDGIIKKIKKIIKLNKEVVKNIDSSIFLQIECLCEIYMPKRDDILSLPIKKVFHYGYYLDYSIYNKSLMKILVAKQNKNGIHEKAEGEVITIKLKEVRFEKTSFHILADILQDDVLNKKI